MGDYGRRDIRAAVNIPLVEGKVNARLAAYSLNTSGWYDSLGTANSSSQDIGKEDKLSLRPTVHFMFSDTVDLTLIGEYHRDESDIRPPKNYSGTDRTLCTTFGQCGTPFDELSDDHDDFDADVVRPGFVDIEIFSITSELNWEMEKGTLTWLSNYRDTDETWVYDADATSVDMFTVDRRQPHEQYSTELRFASDGFDRFDFIGGIFFFHQEYDLERRTGIGSDRLAAVPDPNAVIVPLYSITGQEHEAWSVFGEVNFHVTDQFTITAGGRYTDEKKDYFQQVFSVFPNTGPRQDYSESWDDAGPKFAAKYHVNDDLMVYASYQKGFKSGGFNGRCGQTATCARPFGPEEVDGYEIGIKADFLDNRVRTNIAAFLTDIEGLQRGRIVPLPPGATNPQETVTDNAADAS
ncbi:MAG: TonB-dependent receptor [Gammaproteobacteria bacterium]|nr:TonB-dependent receptor [Gammaproteobacteria bacterium]